MKNMKKLIILLYLFITIKNFSNHFEIEKIYIQKRKDFFEFIHEFHHFIIIQDYGWDLDEMYLHIPKIFFDKKINPSINNIKTIETKNSEYYYKLIKHKLAGYAAEAAFEEKSFLLRLLKKTDYKKNFYTLWSRNQELFSKILDIEEAMAAIQHISLDDQILKNYIKKYDQKKLKIIPITNIEGKILCYLKALVIIYEELKSIFSSDLHQKKINQIIKNNKNLLSYEIFFYKDLKCLWKNNFLERDLNYSSLEKNEKDLIAHLKKVT
jgi:hypothetical protein